MRLTPQKVIGACIVFALIIVLAIAPFAPNASAQNQLPDCNTPIDFVNNPSTYGDIGMEDQYQRVFMRKCRDENGNSQLQGTAGSLWFGRDEDPSGRLDWQTLSGDYKLTLTINGVTTQIDAAAFMVFSNPRAERDQGIDRPLTWTFTTDLPAEWSGEYVLWISAVVRQQDCNNGSGVAEDSISLSRQAPTATATATATATPPPTSTPVPPATPSPVPSATPTSTATATIVPFPTPKSNWEYIPFITTSWWWQVCYLFRDPHEFCEKSLRPGNTVPVWIELGNPTEIVDPGLELGWQQWRNVVWVHIAPYGSNARIVDLVGDKTNQRAVIFSSPGGDGAMTVMAWIPVQQ